MRVFTAWRGADVLPFARAAANTQDLDGLTVGEAEPVRHAGVELGRLTRRKYDVVLSEDQP